MHDLVTSCSCSSRFVVGVMIYAMVFALSSIGWSRIRDLVCIASRIFVFVLCYDTGWYALQDAFNRLSKLIFVQSWNHYSISERHNACFMLFACSTRIGMMIVENWWQFSGTVCPYYGCVADLLALILVGTSPKVCRVCSYIITKQEADFV